MNNVKGAFSDALKCLAFSDLYVTVFFPDVFPNVMTRALSALFYLNSHHVAVEPTLNAR